MTNLRAMESVAYQSANKIRFVTAASLFDGHDATINIMRRILQQSGAEVIHLGHNRSVDEVVNCAIQEDVQGIALTSYQGGHVEYFKYMHDLLKERGAGHIKIFGGGGGVFLPHEIAELQEYGISKIYSPDDGRTMGLQGMINDMLRKCDFKTVTHLNGELKHLPEKDAHAIASLITLAENGELKDFSRLTLNPSPKERDFDKQEDVNSGKANSRFGYQIANSKLWEALKAHSRENRKNQTEAEEVLWQALRNNAIDFKIRRQHAIDGYIADFVCIPKGLVIEIDGGYHILTTEEDAVRTEVLKEEGFDVIRFTNEEVLNNIESVIEQITKALTSQPDRKLKEPSSEQEDDDSTPLLWRGARGEAGMIPVIGITGTGGSGKSSLVDEIVRRFLMETDKTLAIISVDPSKRKTGGALLGDRIRMNAINNPRIYMRSLATRQANLALSKHVQESVDICKAAGYDLIIVETSGIGQSDTMITDYCDLSLYVMTPEFGAATQLEKIDMLDFADMVALNKFDKRGALDAIRDVRKQYKRNHKLFEAKDDELPIYGTMASQFNDPGMNELFADLIKTIKTKTGVEFKLKTLENIGGDIHGEKVYIIPPNRTRYLAEIAENSQAYSDWVNEQCKIAQQLFQVKGVLDMVETQHLASHGKSPSGAETQNVASLRELYAHLENQLHPDCKRLLKEWPGTVEQYKAENFIYKVRDKEIKQPLFYTSLSQLKIPKISLPKYEAWGDILRWLLTENVPGEYPYTAGVFPLKREGEDPTRMFAGEGGPERTNKRFHYVSLGQPAHRLSTAFDSVTLYGEDPHIRPDIYGKIGNAGVSIATLDDAKKLYSGFDLCHASTSVSMTINGPAPMLLGFFMNAAIDQQCEKYITEHKLEHLVEAKFKEVYDDKGLRRPKYSSGLNTSLSFGEGRGEAGIDLPPGNSGLGLMLLGLTGDQVLPADVYAKIKTYAIATVRGTVQADILKEDQAQNTCIFSTEFALRMMGDMQQYFINEKVRNFYSVSISGYHIAEAGANPVTQLAFTLSNGFTYLEYYLSRGMHIDDFAPNLSFFFSNGIDPEYSVIGRVARRIWAKAIKNKYKGNDRSQKLKYHIQTSGRSLHAQEIDFNDIRTTLQALYAIYDNCNSLHTNAYDEAITTPTEESVRRAMAIQLIINRELGLAKNENPIQGAFIIEELTDLVEQAVLTEFKNINDRGGVLGAMETMYQRGKIQEESLYYETLKHNGEYPIVGVNTFLNKNGSPTVTPSEVIRATEEEKQYQIYALSEFQKRNEHIIAPLLKNLQHTAIAGENIFESLMEACKYCSLGQISNALYAVGGQYRRNM